MSPDECIRSLDQALAAAGSEDIILRRIVSATVFVDVVCRARVDTVTPVELAAGIKQTDLHIVISPTQINEAQWPGGDTPLVPPFDLDQRIPRTGQDKVIAQKRLRTVAFPDPKYLDGVLVRINMRVTG